MNQDLQARLRATFRRLGADEDSKPFPELRALTSALERLSPPSASEIKVPPRTAELFATASVDIWRRAVHSFLVSAALTEASPIWSSVCGYYSSHYSIRALAHLLGYFLLFGKKKVVRWSLNDGEHFCSFTSRGAGDREHKSYWNWVKRDEHFRADPMFQEYDPTSDTSDVRHRDRANYSDHVSGYPAFHMLTEQELRERVQMISQIEFQEPPIPDINRFLDLDSVQIVAYHRLVRYRQFLDEALGGEYAFWNANRNPEFARDLINFQIIEPRGLAG